jgi:hypothetical protein
MLETCSRKRGAGRHRVAIAVLPDLGEPEEIAVGLPKLDAIAISGDRIYLIADHRLVAWLPRS